METKTEKVIETAPIRLTGDETRVIMKAATNFPKPISDYRCCALVDLGLMKKAVFPKPDSAPVIAECWKKIRVSALKSDRTGINSQLQKISEFERATTKKDEGYTLTPLGREVARGVTVRMNSQFTAVVR